MRHVESTGWTKLNKDEPKPEQWFVAGLSLNMINLPNSSVLYIPLKKNQIVVFTDRNPSDVFILWSSKEHVWNKMSLTTLWLFTAFLFYCSEHDTTHRRHIETQVSNLWTTHNYKRQDATFKSPTRGTDSEGNIMTHAHLAGKSTRYNHTVTITVVVFQGRTFWNNWDSKCWSINRKTTNFSLPLSYF